MQSTVVFNAPRKIPAWSCGRGPTDSHPESLCLWLRVGPTVLPLKSRNQQTMGQHSCHVIKAGCFLMAMTMSHWHAPLPLAAMWRDTHREVMCEEPSGTFSLPVQGSWDLSAMTLEKLNSASSGGLGLSTAVKLKQLKPFIRLQARGPCQDILLLLPPQNLWGRTCLHASVFGGNLLCSYCWIIH